MNDVYRSHEEFMGLLTLLSIAAASTPPAENSLINRPDARVALRLDVESGFLAPLAHTIQFGTEGTRFDYVEEGGQDVLFPVFRFTAGLDVGKRETFLFLYQPLDIRTSVVMREEVVVDTVTFPAGTPVDLRYGFSFWRASWLHDLAPAPAREVAIGLGLQLRDANIEFTSADGALRSVERDVGPVPLLAVRTRLPLKGNAWFGAEASGIYAPVKYLNGADVDVEGALLDASVRGGLALGHGFDAYVNLRYLAGGAAGTSKNPDGFGDGYTANWLHFATVSLGAGFR